MLSRWVPSVLFIRQSSGESPCFRREFGLIFGGETTPATFLHPLEEHPLSFFAGVGNSDLVGGLSTLA
ncbi:hypothetical protein NL676_009668 [Syzygium grande]|nr:hypothetical protein NL676_009668 [Syzygium grande]